MAREPRTLPQPLAARLAEQIAQVGFYRFCQLLEQTDAPPLGSTDSPHDDPVRFRPHPGMGFPVSELKALESDASHPDTPATVRTTFFGLYGVDSPLPSAYIDDVTLQREGHEALEHFLDIFNHRIMTQFYRIWRKYSYPTTFESGGKDVISQCLLGLMGMAIPGTQAQFATPMSRFLSLLGLIRQPGRTAEGITALVQLLAPNTTSTITAHCLRRVAVSNPLCFSESGEAWLEGDRVLGDEMTDANSQLLIALQTTDQQQATAWLTGEQLYADFLLLLRVYLGWRYQARIELTIASHLLPCIVLGESSCKLGINWLLDGDEQPPTDRLPEFITIELGHYAGLVANPIEQGDMRVIQYRFTG
ncbi:type VI secretion system baseplate subunit TssG [Serratia microhaemolytica]|uniref:type VI secretion system baseplate subunit TssG n=1 Tax=Serratia microhaemolytica TaxID=2675110 RepID=UPI000FDCE7D8|nr:type VI secretion system baseplate subunit TssG [Serratia microhaemolytica]